MLAAGGSSADGVGEIGAVSGMGDDGKLGLGRGK